MDAPDLYHRLLVQQLDKPAIVVQTQNVPDTASNAVNLELIASTAFSKYTKNIGQILSELVRSTYNTPYAKEDDNEPLNEFRFDAANGQLIAMFYYYKGANNQKMIDKIVYRSKEGLVLIIIYKNGVSEMEWHNPKKVSKIGFDVKGFFTQQLEDALAYHKRLERWWEEQETLREKLKKQRKEEEGMIMFAHNMK